MGPVTYEVHHLRKNKVKQVYNVNLVKEWREVPVHILVVSLLVAEVEIEGKDENTLADSSEHA